MAGLAQEIIRSVETVETGEAQQLQQKPEQVREELSSKSNRSPEWKRLRHLEKIAGRDFGKRMQQYDTHRKICGNRNSYSKTDPDATFMRMKDDAMKNAH